MEINSEKAFLQKQEDFWPEILYKLFRNSWVAKAELYFQKRDVFGTDVKLRSIVVSNVTDNMKPFKKHSTVLQKISDVHFSLNTRGQFCWHFSLLNIYLSTGRHHYWSPGTCRTTESPICETVATCLSDERHHWLPLEELWWNCDQLS